MFFQQIFEEKLAQYAYLIGCQRTGEAIIIDPMRDVDRYKELAMQNNLKLVAAAETHIHADYLSGLRELAEQGLTVYASDEGDKDWKYEWLMGSDYDHKLLKDGDEFSIGNIKFTTVYSPGHTPEHVSYLVTDGAATDEPMGILSGDFVFVGDVGRPDLLESAAGQKGAMKSSAKVLYQSLQRFKEMPEYLQLGRDTEPEVPVVKHWEPCRNQRLDMSSVLTVPSGLQSASRSLWIIFWTDSRNHRSISHA
ncbi:MBL fold metallo-hydrolase [Gracilimonas sediminicola]|uniref:MBL fold metallo-hydrolase n=1 Tax=Gracilimonas sediminicola TaxID=2952158 RepID=UPI0038D3608E